MHKRIIMRNDNILYLDELFANNDTYLTTDSLEQNSLKEPYEIEEYILRKQAAQMDLLPDYVYKEEFYPVMDKENKPNDKINVIRKQKRKDKYKPKNVRGKGVMREGMCEECNTWFRLKTSSYWYHMNFKHGVSSNGTKYPDPQIYYTRGKAYSVCEICNQEVLLGINSKAIKYNWYKHFQKEHAKIYE